VLVILMWYGNLLPVFLYGVALNSFPDRGGRCVHTAQLKRPNEKQEWQTVQMLISNKIHRHFRHRVRVNPVSLPAYPRIDFMLEFDKMLGIDS